jgi:hypothetical protein
MTDPDTPKTNGDDQAAAAKAERAEAHSRGQYETNRIRKYLRMVEARAGGGLRGLKTREWVEQQVEKLPEQIRDEEDPVKRLLLTQQLLDNQAILADLPNEEEFQRAEEDFVAVVKGFSERKGLSYAAWRHVRVEPEVLERAGIKRGT